MTLTEIKKGLYKQKPIASFIKATKSGLMYSATFKRDVNVLGGWESVDFLVPLSDIGDATFGNGVESQLLIRYIIHQDTTKTTNT